jgi:FeS assembly SUF system regulator
MLRIGKLTDYGIVLMSYLATKNELKHSAHSLSDAVTMPLPTVKKVLKTLSQGGLLKSERGAQGGYSLQRQADQISVADIITAIEGPIALTECVSDESHCVQEEHCSIQVNSARINNAVYLALDEVKLSDMLLPASGLENVSPINFYPSAKQMKSATEQDGDLNG